MKNYIDLKKDFLNLTFIPNLAHTIRTSPDTVQLFGGALHGCAAKVIEQEKNIPISSLSTTFLNSSDSLSPILVTVTPLVEKKSLSIYNVFLEQEGNLLSVSQAICSPNPVPADQSKFRILVPKKFPEPHNWLWDTKNESIFNYLKAQISLNEGIVNWLDGYKTDISAICTLSDFGSIILVQFLSQIPRTITIHSQFFNSFDSDKLFSEFEILGFSPGSVSVRFDQYDLNGNPVCFSRLTSSLRPMHPDSVNRFNETYKP
jgi:acyl-CoA thioesterase